MIYTNSIKHPKIISNTNGNVELDELASSINRSIALILLTAKGEMYFNPEFGSNLRYYIFNYMNDLLKESLITEIINDPSSGMKILIEKYSSVVFGAVNSRLSAQDFSKSVEGGAEVDKSLLDGASYEKFYTNSVLIATLQELFGGAY